jgi:hypothetical protein
MKTAAIRFIVIAVFLASSCNSKDNSRITRVYENEKNQSIVLFDTEKRKENVLVNDSNYVFWVIDSIQNNEWVLLDKAPAAVEAGRVASEKMLMYVPDKKEIRIGVIDPAYQYASLRFERREGIPYLVINDQGAYRLSDLLSSVSLQQPEQVVLSTDPQSLSEGTELIYLPFDTVNNEYGLKGSSQQIEGARFIKAIPGFGIYKDLIYIVDAMNFRVLVYDFSGKYIKKISYPVKSENGSLNVIGDICADDGIIWLNSLYENAVYVLDSETEDLICKITGEDTPEKKFGSINKIALDSEKNILIVDGSNNTLYYYGRSGNEFKKIKSVPFTGDDQLFTDKDGFSYTTKSEGSKVTLVSSSGKSPGSFNYNSPTGSSVITGTDENNNVYIRTLESAEPGAQYESASYIKVMSQEGIVLKDVKLNLWMEGAILKIDKKGNIFIVSPEFRGGTMPGDEPSGVIISKF